MDFKKLFSSKKQEAIVVGQSLEEQQQVQATNWAQVFYWTAVVILVISLYWTYEGTSSMLSTWSNTDKKIAESLEEKKLNENIVKLLGDDREGRIEKYLEQLPTFQKALPTSPRSDLVVAQLEEIMKDTGLVLPDTLSWNKLSERDVSNESLAELDIYSYGIEVTGRYQDFVEFIKAIPRYNRLMDIRAINGLQYSNTGIIRGTLEIWVYNQQS